METSGSLGTEDIDDCCCNPRTPHSLYIHLTRLVPTMLTSKRRALGEKMHSFDRLIAQPARSISSVNCFLKFQLREILSERFTMAATLVSSNKVFSGFQKVFKHASTTLGAEAKFGIFLPKSDHKVPVIYWLSGLTCTEQNFITKAGAQNYAQKYGVAIVCPDTSPRNCNIPGEDDSYDLGTGAGFYVDATQEPWSNNYKMYSYVTKELPQVIEANFSEFIDTSRCSIMGHSMGGHGALICSLKNPGKYKAVSAFAPICNPSNCGWGQKAFTAYLGDDKKAWSEYDATELAKSYSGPPLEVLVDQGLNDEFLKALLPANLIAVGNEKFKIKYREQEGYDHSYFTIATFIEDHIKMHSEALK